jgi:predicted RNA-binding Zn ribbon-like protein
MNEPEQIPDDELPVLGEALAVDLANSHYIGDGEDLDFLAGREHAEAWFAAVELVDGVRVPARLTEETLAALRRVRDATRAALLEVADTEQVSTPASSAWRRASEVLHREAKAAPAHLALDLTGDQPAWRIHHSGPAGPALAAALASHCILFLGGEQVSRVRRCARPACPMLFVRHHKARRFCTQECAHSVRQARYYRRYRHDAPAGPAAVDH